ncbi:DUF1499 domain-containing protein [Pseudaestuariivita rosea]|uniref:DUF1499 domain-containing protein n=1 Tax=Pseudaestuariivita rosea TaxID=2763263 RepID=UPI001ABAF49A|nr:DUF1499 domain-containing protein [Pseudaestuariivita rosea]
MKFIAVFIVILIVAGLAYIRLAPSNANDWHVSSYPTVPGQYARDGGYTVVQFLDTPPDAVLAEIDRIIMATDRTTRLAGSPDEGMTTYVTRSLVFGFPDYTTVEARTVAEGTILIVNGRLRFGRSDLGVNQSRISGWMDQFTLS